MNKSQLLASMFLVFLFFSCQEKKKVTTVTQPVNELTELQKMRNEANKEYSDMKSVLEKIKTPDTQKLDLSGACNIYYLASIKDGKNLKESDFNRLFKINTKECNDNVEFQQFYNEVLFKSIKGNPSLFYQYYINPKSSKYRKGIEEQLNNPISDAFNGKKLLKQVSRQVQINLKLRSLDAEYQKLLKSVNH